MRLWPATLSGRLVLVFSIGLVLAQALAPLSGDAAPLRRCINNLVDNAVLYGLRARLVVEDSKTQFSQSKQPGGGLLALLALPR